MENQDAVSPLPTGTMVREFKIEGKLGQGGFGIVYRATHEILGETVAIKEFLPPDLARRIAGNRVEALQGKTEAYEWAREKFLHEARTLKALADPRPHPNLVQVIHAFPENDTVYMCMRYEQGTPLDALLSQRGRLSEEELCKILFPLLDGLAHAHAHGVWHRDIKPSNILVRADGSPVLIDFGAARQETGDQERSVLAQCTPGYAAPEQMWGGEEQGPWTDIYALGATLYRAITGNPPHGFSPPNLRSDYQGAYSERFLAAVDAALEPKPGDRMQTVAEWRRRFESVIAEPGGADAPTVLRGGVGAVEATRVARPSTLSTPLTGPGGPPQPPVQPRVRVRRLRTWPWASLAVAMIMLGGLGLWRLLLVLEPEPESVVPSVQKGGLNEASPATSAGPQASVAEPEAPPVGPVSAAESKTEKKGVAVDSDALEPAETPADAASEQLADKEPKVPTMQPGEPGSVPAVTGSTPGLEVPQPSDGTPAARAETLGEIERAVTSLGCARLQASLSPDGALSLHGHIGSDIDLEALRARLLALSHVHRLEDEQVQILGQPFCQVLAMLLDATKGVDRTLGGPSIALNNARGLYREGEYLVVTAMNNNPYSGYLYLDYVDLAGDVVHMLPTPTDPDNRITDWGEVVVGAEDAQTCSRRQCYKIWPPHGRSMVVAIWSRTPLISGPRRLVVERAIDYFSWLGGVIESAVDNGANELALTYQLLETRK